MKNLLLIPALGVTFFLIVVACGGGGSEKVQVIYSTIGGQFVAFDIQDFVMADGETP